MRQLLLITSLMTCLVSSQALAAKRAAYCHLLDQEGAVVEGVNTQKLYPIASVSKLFTAYWAVVRLGAHYRYTTTFHVLPLGQDVYDLHIQGSNSPYFAKEQLQFVVADLNRRGIRKVRQLTFDEKFAYLNFTRGNSFAAGHYAPGFPTKTRVEAELESFFVNPGAYYNATKEQGRKLKIEMPEKISLTVEKIDFLSSQEFKTSPLAYDKNVLHLANRSVPMHRLLKEMNRNSNNYAANLIFEDLGGADQFNRFIQKQLGVTDKQVIFYNGSGDNHDFDGVDRLYNSATCRVVLSVVASLKKTLEMQKLNLEDVIAVAGADSDLENSTVSNIYGADSTDHSLIAKTGTVNPAITLAGLANTEQGEVYFGYIYSTNGARSDWRSARKMIKAAVLNMYTKYGGSNAINYTYRNFLSFDEKSPLFEKVEAKPILPAGSTELEKKEVFTELFRPTKAQLFPLKYFFPEARYKVPPPPPTKIPYRNRPAYVIGDKK